MLITRLIVVDIALLTVLLCNYLLFCSCPSFYSSNFKLFKNALRKFIPNCPPKHVITSTNNSYKSKS